MGLGIAGAVYLMVTVIAGMAVPADTLADSDGPLLEVVTQGPLSVNSQVFSAIALFAIVNGCLLNLVMASRLMYGMANEGVVPRDPRQGPRGPPDAVGGDPLHRAASPPCWRSSATSTTLADTTVLLLLIVFVGVHVSLLVLRKTPVDHEHFKAPAALPWLGAATCAGLAVQQVVEDPKLVLWAGGLLLFGLILWTIERAVR